MTEIPADASPTRPDAVWVGAGAHRLPPVAGAIAATVLLGVSAVGAQDRLEGIRAGALIFQPSVAVTLGYDDNIFVAETAERSSFAAVIEPRVVIETDWSRHRLRLEAGGRYRYLEASSDDATTEADIRFSGALEVLRAIQIEASFGFQRVSEQRGEDDTGTAISGPVNANVFDGDIAADLKFGRFRISPFAEAAWRNFQDVTLTAGGIGNQDDRDRVEYGAGLEVGYELQRWIEVFVGGRYGVVDFDSIVDDTGVNRDSTALEATAGLKVDLSELLQASAALGVQSRKFEDMALKDVSGLAADIAVVWSITPLTTLQVEASHSFAETTIAGASVVSASDVEVALSHDLLRSLRLTLSLGYGHEDFEGSPRQDDLYSIGLGAEWQITPLLTLAPEYRYRMQLSNVAGEDYTNHQVFLTATYGFR